LAIAGQKDAGALLTIGELSQELGVPQHILRYWETRFPQLKPMQRAGNRRYYRPADVDLARRIHRLLGQEGYTVRGVQKLLRDKEAQAGGVAVGAHETLPAYERPTVATPAVAQTDQGSGIDVFRLIQLRDRLREALDS
jgi:DNA-binding transcriptional MerR regulator